MTQDSVQQYPFEEEYNKTSLHNIILFYYRRALFLLYVLPGLFITIPQACFSYYCFIYMMWQVIFLLIYSPTSLLSFLI